MDKTSKKKKAKKKASTKKRNGPTIYQTTKFQENPLFNALTDYEIWKQALADTKCCKFQYKENDNYKEHTVYFHEERDWAPLYYLFIGETTEAIGKRQDQAWHKDVNPESITTRLNKKCSDILKIPAKPKSGKVILNGMEIHTHRTMVYAMLSIVTSYIWKNQLAKPNNAPTSIESLNSQEYHPL